MGVLVAYAVIVALLLFAAFADHRARRRDRAHVASRGYWEGVHEARRAVRAGRFLGFRITPPSRPPR